MNEQWERWEPIKRLSNKYYIESISDSIKCFKITLCESNDERKKVEVIFDDSVHAYRSTDESFNLKTINTLDEHYGTRFYSNWTFFKVNNSEYTNWLYEQSYGIAASQPLIHFCLIASDSIVDVIAAYEPKIERIS
ncbi:hypothetical protein HXA34_11810 [Salipaludibacillus agaradhaerens]|jgi:hypothetical protein|uniref:hypothetical protein n=1 Tax=Salipaludibacillus agaradhaerens TaxID=76935 RepID=UPI0021518045|nr:hypothetical protein [Salipaludibacillus agaradhaerens]MCR6106975.1 hypothetical protein [Salipaludibacillus agaradhaerens]MCR6119007.1 hypothetical protein [Salipaludibacillus agaradhaerens]